jgi:hypothetical protein
LGRLYHHRAGHPHLLGGAGVMEGGYSGGREKEGEWAGGRGGEGDEESRKARLTGVPVLEIRDLLFAAACAPPPTPSSPLSPLFLPFLPMT